MQSVAGEEDPGASLDLPVQTPRVGPDPADAVAAQAAELTCPTCGGSGQQAGGPCPACQGTGRMAGARGGVPA